MKCSRCGSRDIFYKTCGNHDTKGKVEALCASCHHRAEISSWDHTKSTSWAYAAQAKVKEPTF